MNVTMKTISQMANVSVGTVDRVLNNRGRVKADVERRVRAIAELLNYRPNSVAKTLALRNKGLKVGIVSHVAENYANFAVEQSFLGIKEAFVEFADFGVSPLYHYPADFDVEAQLEAINSAVCAGVCALAVMPINDSRVSQRLDEVISSGIPVFCFINDIDTRGEHYFFGVDSFRVGFVAAGLFDMCRKTELQVAMFVPSLSLAGNQQLMEGFDAALKEHYGNQIQKSVVCVATNDDLKSYRAVKAELSRHSEVNAVFFASGAVHGGFEAIKEVGLLGKALIITLDTSDIVRKMMIDAAVKATIHQNARVSGYRMVKAMYDHLFYNRMPKTPRSFVESQVLTREHFVSLQ